MQLVSLTFYEFQSRRYENFDEFLTAEISPFSVFLGMWKKVTGFKLSRLKFYKSVFTYSIEHYTSFRVIALVFAVVISLNFPCILNGRYIAVFNLFVVMRNSMTGIRIFSASK